ncbi:MAG: hypothetical protein VX874_12560 [Pseudomonadota bacterium]|nr:hypothetical protein [Pseudomonadota bacterium]
MKTLLLSTALAATTLIAAPATAACFADYKAKQDNPLQLHYGVIELPDAACGSAQDAAPEVSRRIAADGWTLLNVVSVFSDAGLEERKASAGTYFLRY